jgi:hypothetical protein
MASIGKPPGSGSSRTGSFVDPASPAGGLPGRTERCGEFGLGVVDHECGHLLEEGSKQLFGFEGKASFGEGVVHELHPAIACDAIDVKRKVAGAQTRMSSLGDVFLRATEAIDEEVAEALLGRPPLLFGIQGAENVIVRNLTIKCGHQTRKTLFADDRENAAFIHDFQIYFNTAANRKAR